MNYDIIGDIHGCNRTLTKLLTNLGYEPIDGVYTHPTRQAIFLGDFVDRFPNQREVIDIVRPMIDSGAALAVMGNHEYNAICYFTEHPETGKYLRKHDEKNDDQHDAFLQAYKNRPEEYKDVINWFKTLPLWLDLGELKIVHACWDKNLISYLKNNYGIENKLNEKLLLDSAIKDSDAYIAIETLLKGKEVKLKDGRHFMDKNNHKRHEIRIRWWDKSTTSYKQAFLGPEDARTNIPDDDFDGDHVLDYSHNEPPVFHGHYWLDDKLPAPLAENIACVDYSVANKNIKGKLVAYRWDGEQKLNKDKFKWVERREENYK